MHFYRGSRLASQVDDTGERTDATATLAKTKFSDMISVYPNVDEFASVRKENEGSWFIKAFCDVMDDADNTNCLEICELLNKV